MYNRVQCEECHGWNIGKPKCGCKGEHTMEYISKAYWPEGTETGDPFGQPISTDRHMTRKEAEGVCRVLERDGFGCNGEIFPIKTEVVEIIQA